MPVIKPQDHLSSSELWRSIGPHDRFEELDISPNSIPKFQQLADFIFNTQKTGLVMEFDKGGYARYPSLVRFSTSQGESYDITFGRLEDDYFHIKTNFPFTLSEEVKKALPYYTEGNLGFLIQDRDFLVDGWDGLKEWAELFQVAKGDCNFWSILLKDLPWWDLFEIDRNTTQSNVIYMKNKYPHIIDYSRTYYFKNVGDNQFVPIGGSQNERVYNYKQSNVKTESFRYLIDYKGFR